jgi:hypothetical protein
VTLLAVEAELWDKEGIGRSKSGAMCRSKSANVSADGYALWEWKLGKLGSVRRGVFST